MLPLSAMQDMKQNNYGIGTSVNLKYGLVCNNVNTKYKRNRHYAA
jgi:hypothetical protein